MMLLAVDSTIFDKMASGAILQLDIIDSSNAAGSAALHLDRVVDVLLLSLSSYAHRYYVEEEEE